jgi:hypothetical protein
MSQHSSPLKQQPVPSLQIIGKKDHRSRLYSKDQRQARIVKYDVEVDEDDKESLENANCEDGEDYEDYESDYGNEDNYDEEDDVVRGFPLSTHSARKVHSSLYGLVREPTDEAGQFLRYQFVDGVERTVFQGPRGGRFYRGPLEAKVYLPGWMYSNKCS